MKIIYNQNPLATQVILDESEKKELLYKIQIQYLKDLLFDAHFFMDKDLERVKETLNPKNYYDDNSQFNESCQHTFNYCIQQLNSHHAGDCTAFACTCTKCYAEDFLGIDTIKGMSKANGSIIEGAFKKYSTIEDVLNYLQNYQIDAKDKYTEIYRQQVNSSIEWLSQYKTIHLDQ